jgi:hypothetical protein
MSSERILKSLTTSDIDTSEACSLACRPLKSLLSFSSEVTDAGLVDEDDEN